ncbi:MAG TPA: ABC transporter substrate-binding protein [Methylomirabilota bacterium]|nr:ABC transporter substrate-binding protein [Methylomirabilota bacterium]
MKVPRLIMIVGLGLGLLSAPLATEAQETGKIYRIGFLSPGGPEQDISVWAPLRDALRERGWAEGQNLVFERRYAEGNYDRLPELAAELVRLKLDLFVARGGPAALAAKRATATIPIVTWGTTDPVGIGLVASLARPGGNITGLSDDQGPEVVGKHLQLLKEVAPRVSKVAVLTRVPPSAAAPRIDSYENAYEALAQALGVHLRFWRLQGPDDIDKAFTAILREGFGALDVTYVVITWTHRRKILDLAIRHRLPAIYSHRTYALDGGLIAYGEDEREVPRRLAVYVDKILRGAKPADLPIEQPRKFELVVNLQTAKAMGLTIPQLLLVRADEVIR